jgi:predicted O-methyltransferase YrrM
MMALPRGLRRLAPDRLRDDPRLRAVFVRAGLVPPRTMHSDDDASVLRAMAQGRRRVVEIGVYEGASAVALCAVLGDDAELHLIDPFGQAPTALPAGWGATEAATRAVVERALRRRRGAGPHVHWHVDLSEDVARRWDGPADLVFIDGDHAEEAVRLDWDHWSPKVAEGGAVVFHDARLSQPGGRGLPGPTAVVDTLFRTGGGPAGWRIAHEADRTVAVVRAPPV